MRRFRMLWKEAVFLIVGAPALIALVAGLCSAVLAANAQAGGYVVERVPGGTIEGSVLYVGKPVQPMTMPNTEDPAYCGSTMTSYPVHVQNGGVVDAVVWIENITHGKPFDFPKAVVNQKKCAFMPSVVLMAPGRLEVENSDPLTHDVQIFAHFNPSSNHTMPPGSKPLELTLMHPETVTIACDIHKDMVSSVIIAKNPYYALTQSGGAFKLTNVPPGAYELKVWQKTLGAQTTRITVHAGQTAHVTFKLGA
jgi:plastocyanin